MLADVLQARDNAASNETPSYVWGAPKNGVPICICGTPPLAIHSVWTYRRV